MNDLRQELASPPDCSHCCCERTSQILRRYSCEGVALPERIRQTQESSYARHLVHQECSDGFCVVAMVWGPGQGTAVHDHGGTWCVEGCVEGRLAITSYRLTDELDERLVRFERENYVEVGRGSVGCLIPPFEHHKIHNPFEEVAITLHVYGRELCNCTRFMKEECGAYRIEKVPLSYTTRPC